MSTALYRRYRPETFAEVIGQDHVTAPLRQALRSGQVNHAYLFSGPRGCGKTTSARILARILNCAANTDASPTDTPCGRCESCVELARGGPGSLDVVEIDAASHGGVDDARELRERATFAPARDRFKIFILDEAHMVTTQGFNALLKIVEEPPPHVKFVFATTEPDKVIGTIRSRTHHYPFRLVPPDVLLPYLEELCAAESVPVGGGVLPLVVRAGGGSVRDSLSVLDQLIAGADEHGIGYEGAAALLGYTQSSLLDDLVDAIAARDGGAAFRVVERVIATGHEPRRFVEDLLERLRDLIVIDAAGEAAGAALRGLPQDQLESMRIQSARLGASELSRSADLVNAALTEMTGATSPRLHLELLMARLLLPAADDDRTGLAARLDRLERGVPVSASTASNDESASGGRPSSGAAPGATTPAATAPTATGGASLTAGPTGAAAARAALAAQRAAAVGQPAAQSSHQPSHQSSHQPSHRAAHQSPAQPADQAPARSSDATPARSVVPPALDVTGPPPWDVPDDEVAGAEPSASTRADAPDDVAVDAPGETELPDEPAPAPAGPAEDEAAAVPGQGPIDAEEAPEPARAALDAPVEDAPFQPAPAGVTGETETLRRRWPEVLDTVRSLRRVTGALVDPNNAQVAELDATTLRLAFTTPELATTFRNGPHADVVAQAVRETLGFDVRVEAVGGPGSSGAAALDGPARAAGTGRAQSPTQRPTAGRPPAGPETRAPRSRPGGGSGRPTGPAEPGAGDDDADPHRAPDPDAGSGTSGARPAPDDAVTGSISGSVPGSTGSSTSALTGSDWEPPEEPDDPWATPVPVDPRPTVTDQAAPAPVSADVPDVPSPTVPAVPAVPAVPGVISAADAAASWDLPPSSASGAARGASPAAAPGTTPARTGAPTVPATPAAAPVPQRDQTGARARTGAPAVSAAESAVARAQRLAAAAPQRSSPAARPAPTPVHDPYDDLSPDDPDMASSGLVGAPLIAQLLGGTVIDEQVDDGRS